MMFTEQCPQCNGTGERLPFLFDDEDVTCNRCFGTGLALTDEGRTLIWGATTRLRERLDDLEKQTAYLYKELTNRRSKADNVLASISDDMPF